MSVSAREVFWRAGAPDRRRADRRAAPFDTDRRRLVIGLVNNMGEAARAATERQFRDLVHAAAPGREVEVRSFHLDGVDASTRMALASGLDALIVTGAEPREDELAKEPFYPALARLADDACALELPVAWSCLAAHAAVLHFSGVERHPLARKLSGVFAGLPATGDPLMAGVGAAWSMPHSRWNGLDADALAAAGYRLLGGSRRTGVDAFARRMEPGGALHLFLQGHPEYDRFALAKEFRRDLQRFIDGVGLSAPELPIGVFGPAGQAAMAERLAMARAGERSLRAAPWPAWETLALRPEVWRAPAAALLRNWLADGRPDAAAERRNTARPGPQAFVDVR